MNRRSSETAESTTASGSFESLSHEGGKRSSRFALRSPPPSQHLKKILENYPEGPQIFKEALQNADDAKAKIFRIILDERSHRCSDPQYDRFMGPAILFSNDAVFAPEDWKGLQNMFESEKAKSPGKIGRFGMGSRSYFHMTDLLTIVSGSQAAFLDPDWCLTDDGGGAMELPGDPRGTDPVDQLLTPLDGVLGFTARTTSFYRGTLLRLPLRMGRWARTSTFAPYEYSSSKALSLLLKFKREAAECLLFLQSIQRIELWRWSESEDYPLQLFGCSIRPGDSCNFLNDSSVLKWHSQSDKRGSIRDFLEDQRKWGQDLKSTLCQADTGHLPELDDVYTLEEVDFLGSPQVNDNKCDVSVTLSRWLLNIRLVSNSDFLPYLHYTKSPPIVGIALLVCPPSTRRQRREFDTLPCSQSTILAVPPLDQKDKNILKSTPIATVLEDITPQISWAFDGNDQADELRQGQAFCFLPLSDVITGLPVHVHGTFQLTDNRRSLWMAVDDTAQKWSEWNCLLLTTAIPQLYVRALLRFAQISIAMLKALEDDQARGRVSWDDAELASRNILDNYYNAWPNPHCVTPAFQELLCEFVHHVKVIIRQPQGVQAIARRLAGSGDIQQSASSTAGVSRQKKLDKNTTSSMPPFRPVECHYLDLTDVESHVFATRRDVLVEAVAQCQLLGHRVVLVPDWITDLLKEFDNDKASNPATMSQNAATSLGLRHQRQTKPRNGTKSQQSDLPGYYIVSVLDVFSTILFPHWSALPIRELQYIPHYTSLMLCLCKILGRGPDKYILKFRDVCMTLPFIPTKFPNVEYDDSDMPPLRTPTECFDPLLNGFKVGQLSQPDVDFRAPDVLRVLRLWGLRQHLGWTEIAQEAVSRVCVVGGCNPGQFTGGASESITMHQPSKK